MFSDFLRLIKLAKESFVAYITQEDIDRRKALNETERHYGSVYDSLQPDITRNLAFLQKFDAFSPNLFEIRVFDQVQISRFYCVNFRMASPSIELERHPLSKRFFIKSYKEVDTVDITWNEDRALSVWRFHNEWLTNFYDRATDSFKTGATGKKKDAIVVVQQFEDVNMNTDSDARHTVGDYKLTDIHKLRLEGLSPENPPGLELGWDKSSENHQVTITYKIDRWYYERLAPDMENLFNWEYESGKNNNRIGLATDFQTGGSFDPSLRGF
jgi:hypothetical protein